MLQRIEGFANINLISTHLNHFGNLDWQGILLVVFVATFRIY